MVDDLSIFLLIKLLSLHASKRVLEALSVVYSWQALPQTMLLDTSCLLLCEHEQGWLPA